MAEKEKKPGLFARIGKYFRDARGEFKKIIWPTRSQVTNNTVVVLTVVLVAGIAIFALDSALGGLLQFLLKMAA